MANNVVEIIEGVVGQLKEIARTESIVGEPITIGNKTLVPIIRVSIGFGAGGGEGSDDRDRGGFGGGGGGGAKVEPAAFIVIDENGISLLPTKPGTIDSLIEAIPTAIGKLGKLAKNFSSSEKNSEKSSPSDSDSEAPEAPEDSDDAKDNA